MTVYPNPGTGFVSINLPLNFKGWMTITNAHGGVSMSRHIQNGGKIDLDLSAYEGINIIRLRAIDGTLFTTKVIILK